MSKTFHYDDTLGFVRRTLRYGNAPTIQIKKIPSADVVERKRGEWIGGNGVDYVRCGCCHKDYDWVSQAQYYNFCPNCGAKMKMEGEDGEIS